MHVLAVTDACLFRYVFLQLRFYKKFALQELDLEQYYSRQGFFGIISIFNLICNTKMSE